jgi:hypothetical protein
MNTFSSPPTPRIESLHHRLQTAKGPDGEPLSLIDDLMVFLEDPPPDIGDRWQAGADRCAKHGITASRMAVWRFYREHVLEWRREQAPAFGQGEGEISEESIAKLIEEKRHLIHLRAVESLRHPCLPPRVLVGLVESENRRQELQLARDKFNDLLRERQADLTRRNRERVENEAKHKAMIPYLRIFAENMIVADAKERDKIRRKL